MSVKMKVTVPEGSSCTRLHDGAERATPLGHWRIHWATSLAAVGSNIEAASPKAKYAEADRILIHAPRREFMLTFHLSTPKQPYSTPDEPHVITSFGELYFRPRVEP